jgi:transcription elongation factor Elf1
LELPEPKPNQLLIKCIFQEAMLEHFFQCPYCWETISVLVDTSEIQQTYIEDCEVCCNPMELTMNFLNQEIQSFQARELGQ